MSNTILGRDGEIVDPYRSFISKSRYSKWLPDESRRETWTETVDRYVDGMKKKVANEHGDTIDKKTWSKIRSAILNHEVMPSMRGLMTAGPALERNELAIFNCSFMAIREQEAFSELLYILMHGVGAGYSVEGRYVAQLPIVPKEITQVTDVVVVEDSKEGWAAAYKELVARLYNGEIPAIDITKVRPAGARLQTFGGRASGPQPLIDLFDFTINKFKGAAGRRLTPLEAHDICCKVGDVVVVGGVRRSALISLSDLDSYEMAKAKAGAWWETEGQRRLANNSAVYEKKPSVGEFLQEWGHLYESKSGERGIYNRELAQSNKYSPRRDGSKVVGVNPCAEINLRDMGLCNLSEVIVSADDDLESLLDKVEIATIIGTIQSTFTDFEFLRPEWKANAEEERLLGVSLTGQFGNELLSGKFGKRALKNALSEMRKHAVSINKRYAKSLGINQSAAITTVKPSGCRPGEAITTTASGIYTLDELLESHPTNQDWSDANLVATNGDKISKTYRNGVDDVAKISLSHGYELESTYNHQWFVSGFHNGHKYVDSFEPAWVKTEDLLPGHVIETNVGSYINEDDALLDNDFPRYHNVVERTVPSRMNADLGWLIGYLWGDGSMSHHKKRLRFTDENINHLEKAQRILTENFGYGGNIYKSSGERDCHSLEVASAEIFDFFIHNGVWKYGDGRMNDIPLVVRESSFETGLAFLAGIIDSDGCVYANKNGRSVNISTADEQFAKHLQQVSLAWGIAMGRSHNTKGENLQGDKSMWLLGLNGESDEIRFEILSSHSEKMKNVLPELEFTHVMSDRRRFVFGKVRSVEYSRTVETFDVEVENSHWYEAGAFKSHNTVSQLTYSSAGMHPWHSEYYLRTVRADIKDPLNKYMTDMGVPSEPDLMNPDSSTVFTFPVKAPEGAITRNDLTAVEHLEIWLMYKKYWTEHNPSITVSVREHEWIEVANWVYDNWDDVGGLSFLPHTEHTYKQAPYQECDETTYKQFYADTPKTIDWSMLSAYEFEDNTVGSQTLSCTSGSCELVDLSS